MAFPVVPDMSEVRIEPRSVTNEMGPPPDGVGADLAGTTLPDGRVRPNMAIPSRGPLHVALPMRERSRAVRLGMETPRHAP